MIYNKYTRGSEWRKWDLHVHTKRTNKNDQFKSPDFNSFCEQLFRKAIEKQIAVIGITDYFSIDRYREVIQYQKEIDKASLTQPEKNAINDILLLPNIELRMLPVTDSGKLINIHCIVNPDYVDFLEHDFFNKIEHAGAKNNYAMNRSGFIGLGKELKNSLPNDNAYYIEGVNNFVVEHGKLKKLLDENKNLKENIIVVVSNSNKDGASAMQKHYELFEGDTSSLDGVRKSIYYLSQCIFSGNPSDKEYFTGNKRNSQGIISDNKEAVIVKCGSLKACIHGSDAHDEDSLFNPDEDRFCWIKADPTFDGLKQIIYEPEERVKIQTNKPEDKAGYHVIDSITLKQDGFWDNELFFNPNLNTIIGGRSTGKSTLLQCVAKKIDNRAALTDKSEAFINPLLESVEIKWQDGGTNSARDIEFFPQSHMHEIAKDSKKIDDLIEKIVRGKDSDDRLLNYQSFCDQNRIDISSKVNQLFQLQLNINTKQRELKEKGDKKGIEAEILSIEEKVKGIKSNTQISGDELEQYKDLLKQIALKTEAINQIDKDIVELNKLHDKSILNSTIEYDLNSLSETTKGNISSFFVQLKKETDEKWTKILNDLTENLATQKEKLIVSQTQQQQSTIYKKGYQYSQGNKEFNELQLKQEEERKKLASIIEIEQKINAENEQKNVLKAHVIELHQKYYKKATELTENIKYSFEGIEISSTIVFRKNDFQNFLEGRHNLRSYENQAYYKSMVDEYQTHIKERIDDYLENGLKGWIEYKGGHVAVNVSSELLSTNWFAISYNLNYQNDSFDSMSQGKQAFVVLKLLLEFSDKKCPILIDQPEDSLDNRAIYNELVEYIKQKKKDRQIIIVTHNPNVVVGADAEQIIVANQNGKDSCNKDELKFQYVSGGLEHSFNEAQGKTNILESKGIRQHICEILEGGIIAFQKREQKYSFRNGK